MRLPARGRRRRSSASRPRRRTLRVPPGRRRALLPGLRPSGSAAADGACARAGTGGCERIRARRARAHARDAGGGQDGRRADDVHRGLVRRVRRRRRRDAAPRVGAGSQDRAGDRAHAPRERHRGRGDGALQARHRAGDERGADRGRVGGVRPRRGDGLGRQGRTRARILARLVGCRHQDVHGHDRPTRRRGRADALRDLGLRRRLLVRPHEEPRRR